MLVKELSSGYYEVRHPDTDRTVVVLKKKPSRETLYLLESSYSRGFYDGKASITSPLREILKEIFHE